MNMVPNTEVLEDTTEEPGILLARFRQVNRYRGSPAFLTYPEAVGTLSVFDNRLEFHIRDSATLAKTGGSTGDLLCGVLAMCMTLYDGVTRYDETEGPGETCFLDEIAELRVARYMGIRKLLVIIQKNGEVWSFSLSNSFPRKVLNLLKPYMEIYHIASEI